MIISDNEIDIPWAKKEIKEIGYELVSYKSEPYEKKDFSILENNKNIWKNQEKCAGVVRISAHCDITKVMLQ